MPEDRVQMPSLNKDGTIDQTENYEIIGDKEAVTDAIATRDAQNATAEAGAAKAAEQAATDDVPADTSNAEIDAIVEEARAGAEAEVEARWVDPAARAAEPETTTTRRSRRSATTEE